MSEKKATEKEATEIIELAINELDLLTRAFSVITEAWGDEPCIDQAEPLSIH
jgi:hypothetical protein